MPPRDFAAASSSRFGRRRVREGKVTPLPPPRPSLCQAGPAPARPPSLGGAKDVQSPGSATPDTDRVRGKKRGEGRRQRGGAAAAGRGDGCWAGRRLLGGARGGARGALAEQTCTPAECSRPAGGFAAAPRPACAVSTSLAPQPRFLGHTPSLPPDQCWPLCWPLNTLLPLKVFATFPLPDLSTSRLTAVSGPPLS